MIMKKLKKMIKISILGLTDFEPDKPFECKLQHVDGNSEKNYSKTFLQLFSN